MLEQYFKSRSINILPPCFTTLIRQSVYQAKMCQSVINSTNKATLLFKPCRYANVERECCLLYYF